MRRLLPQEKRIADVSFSRERCGDAMNSNSTPKTFLIHASWNDDEGFLRFRSYQTSTGKISYGLTLVRGKSEASRFLNYDNVKKTAMKYMKKYSLSNVKVIDFANGKVTHVKEGKI